MNNNFMHRASICEESITAPSDRFSKCGATFVGKVSVGCMENECTPL